MLIESMASSAPWAGQEKCFADVGAGRHGLMQGMAFAGWMSGGPGKQEPVLARCRVAKRTQDIHRKPEAVGFPAWRVLDS